MNKIKITPEVKVFIRTCLFLRLPMRVISQILKINESAIRKHSTATKKEVEESGPKPTGRQLKLELFKLYAWCLTDEKDIAVAFQISGEEIKNMQKAIFDYLKLDEAIAYLEGVLQVIDSYQTITFEEKITEEEKKLVRSVLGEAPQLFYKQPYRHIRFFEECIRKIHNDKNGIYFPFSDEVANSKEIVKKIAQEYIEKAKLKTAPYISSEFVALLKNKISTLPRHIKFVIEEKFELPTLTQADREYFVDMSDYSRVRFYRKGMNALKSAMFIRKKDLIVSSLIPEWNEVSSTVYLLLKQLHLRNRMQNQIFSEKQRIQASALVIAKHLYQANLVNSNLPIEVTSALLAIYPDLKEKLDNKDSQIPDILEIYNEKRIELLCKSIDDFDLSVRLYNCLRGNGITYLWHATLFERSDFKKFRNFGNKSLAEFDEFMRKKDLAYNTKYSPELEKFLEEKTKPYGS